MGVLLVLFCFLIQCCYYKQILSCLIFCFSNTAATLQIFSNRKDNSLLLQLKLLSFSKMPINYDTMCLKHILKNSYFNYINLFFISMNLKANNRSRENPNKSHCLRILALKATSNLI